MFEPVCIDACWWGLAAMFGSSDSNVLADWSDNTWRQPFQFYPHCIIQAFRPTQVKTSCKPSVFPCDFPHWLHSACCPQGEQEDKWGMSRWPGSRVKWHWVLGCRMDLWEPMMDAGIGGRESRDPPDRALAHTRHASQKLCVCFASHVADLLSCDIYYWWSHEAEVGRLQ